MCYIIVMKGKRMRKILIVLCLITCVISITGCFNQRSIVTPLQVNLTNVPDNLSNSEIEQVILFSLNKNNWETTSYNKNDIDATYKWRQHLAQIIIETHKGFYTVKYGGSKYLNYRPSLWLWSGDMSINRKYNTLVDRLVSQIHSNLYDSTYAINLIKKQDLKLQEYKKKMDNLVGKSLNHLYLEMGPPDSTYPAPDKSKIVIYMKKIERGDTYLKGFFVFFGGAALIKKASDYIFYQYFYINTDNIVTKWKEEVKER